MKGADPVGGGEEPRWGVRECFGKGGPLGNVEMLEKHRSEEIDSRETKNSF